MIEDKIAKALLTDSLCDLCIQKRSYNEIPEEKVTCLAYRIGHRSGCGKFKRR